MSTYSLLDKDDVMDKWKPIFDSLGHLSDDKKEWLGKYTNQHQLNSLPQPVSATQSMSNAFPNLVLPIARRVAAQTIGLDLVAVKPIGGGGESEEDKSERIRKVRDGKIDAVIEGKEWNLPKELEEPKGPLGELMYMDYNYGTSSIQTKNKKQKK